MKFVVGKCKKHAVYRVFQVNERGSVADILGCFSSKEKPCDTNCFSTKLISNKPCPICGNTVLGGCNHSAKTCSGKLCDGCRTCSEIAIDSSYSSSNSFYGNYVGMNDIPGKKDKYNNYRGSDGDLGRDGAFQGKTVVVICLYSHAAENADTMKKNISKALHDKGFNVNFYSLKDLPAPQKLKAVLLSACQLWLISDYRSHLSSEHIKVITDFYNFGHGLYLWGDNDPWFKDVNIIINNLFGTELKGNYRGDKVIGVRKGKFGGGIIAGHPMSTGIANFYEGISISSIIPQKGLKPLVYSSDGKIVCAYCDDYGRRLLVDGGFTRLYCKWDSAGTDRYVKNAAVWLANVERFN